jgi:serine/threonine protein phosphatase 1
MSHTTYAIGDIHGHLDKLKAAHALIAADRAAHGATEAEVVHVGDYVDRGPDNPGVIDYLLAGQAAGAPWVTLMGNHDRMFLMFLANPRVQDHRMRVEYYWLHPNLGGLQTLASYGVDISDPEDWPAMCAAARRAVPTAHVRFLLSLADHHRAPGLYFAHAGIKPGVPLDDQVEDDLIWIRGEFHDSAADHGALIVHGHTPVGAVTHYGNRVNIDTGAGMGRDLSTIAIEDGQVYLLTETGRQPVNPKE